MAGDGGARGGSGGLRIRSAWGYSAAVKQQPLSGRLARLRERFAGGSGPSPLPISVLTDGAAALTYYTVLSLFPGIALLISAVALIGGSGSAETVIEAIREIVALYEDGILEKPEAYAYAFPDLLTFHDAPTAIEQRLFEMHLKHRMRAFQGAFHANPDYALWYGWSEMVRDLRDIREHARDLREKHATQAVSAR